MAESTTTTAMCSYKMETVVKAAMDNETRCPYPRCNRILFKGMLGPGSLVDVMCPKCKKHTILQVVQTEN